MTRLLIFALLLSACASGRLRYVPLNKHVDLHEENVKSDRTDRLLEDSVHHMLVEQAVEQTYLDSKVEIRKETKDDLAQRVLEQLEREDPVSYRKMNAIYEKATRYHTENTYAQSEDEKKTGRVLLIIALIMAMISLLFFIRANTVSNTDSSAEGCVTAIANIFLFTFFAIVFGIAAVVLLVLGIVVISANSGQKKS